MKAQLCEQEKPWNQVTWERELVQLLSNQICKFPIIFSHITPLKNAGEIYSRRTHSGICTIPWHIPCKLAPQKFVSVFSLHLSIWPRGLWFTKDHIKINGVNLYGGISSLLNWCRKWQKEEKHTKYNSFTKKLCSICVHFFIMQTIKIQLLSWLMLIY